MEARREHDEQRRPDAVDDAFDLQAGVVLGVVGGDVTRRGARHRRRRRDNPGQSKGGRGDQTRRRKPPGEDVHVRESTRRLAYKTVPGNRIPPSMASVRMTKITLRALRPGAAGAAAMLLALTALVVEPPAVALAAGRGCVTPGNDGPAARATAG